MRSGGGDTVFDFSWVDFNLFEVTYDVVVFVVGITAVLAALGVILCSSPIYCALYLIGHMMCLALLFLLYHAEFIAAVQIIVYAGAVMILFLFIIALLGGKKEKQEFSFHKFMALGFVGILSAELMLSARVGKTQPVEGMFTPAKITEVGSAKAVGIELFSRHLVPFELASILLLVAAVGVICLAKFPLKPLRRRAR